MEEHERPWRPLSPSAVADLFKAAAFPWWIAGGHAIELAVGRTLRDHGDIDVLLLRRDQAAAQVLLAGWDLWVADPPGRLRPWRHGEALGAAVHDVWCRPDAAAPWALQLMLDEAEGAQWRSRRDRRITRPIAALGRLSPAGIPYLAPEVQLYYKAKAPRAKDELDLGAVIAAGLPAPDRAWLADAIAITYGAQHAWLPRLRAPSGGEASGG